jgi:hypothetical protein
MRRQIDGRGFVRVNASEAVGLGEPYKVNSDAQLEEPAYMMSVFHQLHCLVGVTLQVFFFFWFFCGKPIF